MFYIGRWWRQGTSHRITPPEHPSDAWVLSEREKTGLYPDDWIDNLRAQDTWTACPWWLDYPEGEFPPNEAQEYAGKWSNLT